MELGESEENAELIEHDRMITFMLQISCFAKDIIIYEVLRGV